MKINTKVRYGLRTMVEIANSKNAKGVLQREIAESQNIPLNYLDSIITGLRNAGLIINFQGKSSGYKLARRAEEISVYDVYRAFEPELNLVDCKCVVNECKRIETCPVKDYWFDLNKNIKNSMMAATIGSITLNKEVFEFNQ